MNEHYLKKLLSSQDELDKKIEEYQDKGQIDKVSSEKHEIDGHIEKAEHNLKFVTTTEKNQFSDWILVGCYYTLYHAALGLLNKMLDRETIRKIVKEKKPYLDMLEEYDRTGKIPKPKINKKLFKRE